MRSAEGGSPVEEAQLKTLHLELDVTYSPGKVTPEEIREWLDQLLTKQEHVSGVLQEMGNPAFSFVQIKKEA